MTLDIATTVVQLVAASLFAFAAFTLRHAAMGAFRQKLTPVQVLETPVFFLCVDIAYNLTAFRVLHEPFLMLAGATLHCIVAVKVIIAIRVVRAWR